MVCYPNLDSLGSERGIDRAGSKPYPKVPSDSKRFIFFLIANEIKTF